MRINKYLALSGLGSRRKCEEYIKSGIVKINGNVVRDLSSQINNTDLVTVKNKLITVETHKIYYLLNKPKGYICSTKDPYSRKTIYDLIPNKDRIFSAGRLDYDTSGLIILTNDGDFSNFLCHPKNNIVKKYHVETDKKIENSDVIKIKNGVRIDNKYTVKAFTEYKGYNKNKYIWDVHLIDGKNREIKKIFSLFNSTVKKIHRYEYAGIQIGNLKSGKYRIIKKNQINMIKKKYDY